MSETNPTYVVTDCEFDGPVPGNHSMMSFASVAVDHRGKLLDEFEAVLEPLPEAGQDQSVIMWFKTQPEAFAAATKDPQHAAEVFERFVRWVRALPGEPIFVSHPLAIDGIWFDYYLKRFANIRLVKGPMIGERLFYHGCLCLRSYAAGKLGWPLSQCHVDHYSPEWLGHHVHTHKAIDDARGYAHLLATLLTGRHEAQ